jgi:SAM-dependent methyltransferase
MSLAEEYRRQRAWRSWPQILETLPLRAGGIVLDLGCGPGDLARELVERGARVIGYDASEELLSAARSLGLPNAEFRVADLRALPETTPCAEGIWCSFAAAYFVDFAPVLRRWVDFLAPGGWMALVEIDDLFAHEPVQARTRELLAAYAEDSLGAERYDFRMGRRLAGEVERAGLVVERAFTVPDRELAFDGAAEPAVLAAWRLRFERMGLLRTFCGAEHAALCADFLACLARPDHRSLCTLRVVIARRPRSGGR